MNKFFFRGDLGKLLDDRNRLTEDEARFFASEITLAIEKLHEEDIIFRDLKPTNIVIDEDGHA
jgi:serine/threonine protein kinase